MFHRDLLFSARQGFVRTKRKAATGRAIALCESMVTRRLAKLDANARDLFAASMRWMESHWDGETGLLWDSGDARLSIPHHAIRGSIWYAFGLFMRDGAGDAARAIRVIDTLLNYQLDAPGRVFHGTFLRSPEETYPPDDAIIWRDYDPNWREFITTVLQLIVHDYADRVPEALVQRIDHAMRQAVEGSLARGLSAAYTNIALMQAFMLCFAGRRFGEPTWLAEGERMARQVYALFKQHDAFAEYNSPTYYGVDLYALALWRSYPSLSAFLTERGQEMEALLWRDVAQFYHAELRNLAGPYDRSYGMDMCRYVSVMGIWMRLATNRLAAPFPDTDLPFAHEHDLGFVPLLAFLGPRVPADALEHLLAFRGERQIERVISDAPRRVVTAWLGKDRMLGGEITSLTPPASTQLHPATLHWRIDADRIGWVRLVYRNPVDARASKDCLEITTTGEISFLVHAPGSDLSQIHHGHWSFAGLSVDVDTNADTVSVQPQGELFEIRYIMAGDGLVRCTLQCEKEIP